MSSGHYGGGYDYQYSQNTSQQYPSYSSSSNVPQQPIYDQTPSTQAQYHAGGYSAQSYPVQDNGYSSAEQSNTWDRNSNYGRPAEATNRAAEVLRDLSKTSYTPASSSIGYQSNVSSSKPAMSYSNKAPNSPRLQSQVQAQVAQNRPRSVDPNRNQAARQRPQVPTIGYPAHISQDPYSRAQQPSPNMIQQQRNTTPANPPPDNSRAASQQYDYSSMRQLPAVDNSRGASNTTSYSNANSRYSQPAVTLPAPNVNMTDAYTSQSATTVDPTAIYDPYYEYQKKLDAARAQEEKRAEERRAEEAREAEVKKRVEDAERERERKRQELEDERREEAERLAAATASEPAANPEAPLEDEIRAMMAKMRELNSKNPALLARIWEEERKVKTPKNAATQSKPSAQPAPAIAASTPVQATPSPRLATSKAKPAPRPSAKVNTATPAQRQTVSTPTSRSGGDTVWPPEKRLQLAVTAVTYLNGLNPNTQIETHLILDLFEDNPAYIELCERLEQMGLNLDRAVFAKVLLATVPDINSNRKPIPRPAPVVQPQAPPAVMKKTGQSSTSALQQEHTPLMTSFAAQGPIDPLLDDTPPVAEAVPVAEMITIKTEPKPPATKEEAARKRNLSELVDLTLLSDGEGEPATKRTNMGFSQLKSEHSNSPSIANSPPIQNFPSAPAIQNFRTRTPINNFPMAQKPPTVTFPTANPSAQETQEHAHAPVPAPIPPELRHRVYVQPLSKKNARRRNSYNPATIARDVLLACGRHPSQRPLNQHLDILRTTLDQINGDSDLSTIDWDLIDPGTPPPGYFKTGEPSRDLDDDEYSGDDEAQADAASASQKPARVQALPEPSNPFRRKGRPPRTSFPAASSTTTPARPTNVASMSSSAPSLNGSASGTGYAAFRPVAYGPDGNPLPKKKGRPVGWRKHIHGSAAAQANVSGNGITPSRPKHGSARPDEGGRSNPVYVHSGSPGVSSSMRTFQSYDCKWQNCQSRLHNLETLKKHVSKVHHKPTPSHTLECLWDNCGKETATRDPDTNMTIERQVPYSFDLVQDWERHMQQSHFDPLSWKLGDGPTGGLSDTQDSDAYLSDANGRSVTPRIVVEPSRLQASIDMADMLNGTLTTAPGRGLGRPPKASAQQEAREAMARFHVHKKRVAAPGFDRGGATLANDKRRRGFVVDDSIEPILVEAEDHEAWERAHPETWRKHFP